MWELMGVGCDGRSWGSLLNWAPWERRPEIQERDKNGHWWHWKRGIEGAKQSGDRERGLEDAVQILAL